MSSDRAPARQRSKDASASSAFDDARVAAVLARVASVKARSDALDEKKTSARDVLDEKKTSARDVLDADALDVDALVDGLDALRVTSAPTTRHPIARVQTPPPLERRRHRRTVSTSAAVSATREESAATRVGIVHDEAMELHEKEGHFEQPARHRVVVNEMKAQKLYERCSRISAREATEDELLLAHSSEHVAFVAEAFDEKGEGVQVMTGENVFGDDIFFTRHTAAGARMAAGCVVEACSAVCRGECDRAFAVVRPPGHHAVCAQAMGFCFFNNCVVAARAAMRESESIRRVCILDWDVHHGNGSQDLTIDDENIMYISLHRYGDGFYPGTGAPSELGAKGTNVNVGWSEKGLGDADYLAAFDVVIEPVLQSFEPDLIIIAAGFDAADGDPLGGMMVTTRGYMHMTKRLVGIQSRVVVALEGGYALRPLATCAAATLRGLLGEEPEPISSRSRPRKTSIALLTRLAEALGEHWNVFKSENYKESVRNVAKRATVVGSVKEYPVGRRAKPTSSSSSTQTTVVSSS